MMAKTTPIPITIISGFLGSGKTTLLNHFLKKLQGKRVAVIVNDFGSVNIDAKLIIGREESIINLANGCICCSIRSDFLKNMLSLVDSIEPPEHILIETSSVADPAAIALTLKSPDIMKKVCLTTVITVIDAKQMEKLTGQMAQHVKTQIEAADYILLNKVDLINNAGIAIIRDWLEQIKPGVPIFEGTYCNVPQDKIMDINLTSKPLCIE